MCTSITFTTTSDGIPLFQLPGMTDGVLDSRFGLQRNTSIVSSTSFPCYPNGPRGPMDIFVNKARFTPSRLVWVSWNQALFFPDPCDISLPLVFHRCAPLAFPPLPHHHPLRCRVSISLSLNKLTLLVPLCILFYFPP